MTQCRVAAFDGQTYRPQEHVSAEWFRKKFAGSRLHGFYRHRHAAVARYEDDRHVDPIDGDAPLQFKPIEVRKGKVKDKAAWRPGSWTVEEILNGGKCLPMPASAANERVRSDRHLRTVR